MGGVSEIDDYRRIKVGKARFAFPLSIGLGKYRIILRKESEWPKFIKPVPPYYWGIGFAAAPFRLNKFVALESWVEEIV